MDRIVDTIYRMGDVVHYMVKFQDALEEIKVPRAKLLSLRPRGYIRQLRIHCELARESYIVEKILGRMVKEHKVAYYCKFLKYPEVDACWVFEDDIKIGKDYLSKAFTTNQLIGKQLIGSVVLKKKALGPNEPLFNKNPQLVRID